VYDAWEFGVCAVLLGVGVRVVGSVAGGSVVMRVLRYLVLTGRARW
jgi:hypothetical protein